jgi:hypothetical protein
MLYNAILDDEVIIMPRFCQWQQLSKYENKNFNDKLMLKNSYMKQEEREKQILSRSNANKTKIFVLLN